MDNLEMIERVELMEFSDGCVENCGLYAYPCGLERGG